MVRNAILLTVDALGAGHVGRLGYKRDTTPRIDTLATESRWFTSAIAQSSHTRESMPSLFSSSYPTQLGGSGTIPTEWPTLPENLWEAGLATAGFHSNPYLSRAYGFHRGFDRFDDSLPLARNRLVTFGHRLLNHFKRQPYTRAESLNDQGLNWLDQTDHERRFLWLHYMDPHGPYQPPPRFQRQFRDEVINSKRAKRLWRRSVDEPETFTEAEQEILVDLYDAEIRYIDEMIGEFLNGLSSRGLLSDSVVVIGADHGDAFGEHGHYGHPRHLYEELIHVPLLVRTPENEGASIDRPVENVDIAPTIHDALDIAIPSKFEGRSLLDSSLGTAAADVEPAEPGTLEDIAVAEAHGEDEDEGMVRTAIRTTTEKLQVTAEASSGEIQTTELFDLSVDSGEREARDDPDVRKRLLELYQLHRARVGDRATASREQPADVDAVVENRLRDLGYR